MNDVEYYINGHNFKDYHVFVSGSHGIIGRLARKESLAVDWSGYHGIVRDNRKKRYQSRKITLECFIEAPTRSAFIERVNSFWQQLDGDGTHRLKIDAGGLKPLVYEVVQLDEADTDKKWGKYYEDLMIGTFKMPLVEDEPVKRVLSYTGSGTATITLSSSKILNIHWGDGTHTYNVHGQNVTASHSYFTSGQHEIIVSGVIEDITSFTTNASIVWNILK